MKLKRKIKQDKVFTIISGAARKKRDFLGVMEVRSKILTPLETTGGNSFTHYIPLLIQIVIILSDFFTLFKQFFLHCPPAHFSFI